MKDIVAVDAGLAIELSEDILEIVAGGGGGHWDPNGATSMGSNGALPSFDPDG
jgi:hypothetical protein